MIRSSRRGPRVTGVVILCSGSLALLRIQFERAIGHTQWSEYLLIEEIAVAFSRNPGHDVAQNTVAQIRVVEVISRWRKEDSIAFDRRTDRSAARRVTQCAFSRIGRQSRGVGCDPPNSCL